MYPVVFDKSGEGPSGRHYEKLREFESGRIQRSTMGLEYRETAERFAETLSEFSVQKIGIFRATEVTGIYEGYEGS